MRKFLVLIVIFIFSSFLISCKSASDIYSYYDSGSSFKQLFEKSDSELNGLNTKERAHYYAVKALDTAKPLGLGIGIVSLIIGVIIIGTVKKELKIRKKAIFTFIIGIPLLCVIIVALLAALALMLK